jgi:hypothetical protein
MANPTIGGYPVLDLQGSLPMARRQFQNITRPGIAGKEYLEIGYYGDPKVLTTITAIVAPATCQDALTAYKNLEGVVVIVTLYDLSSWGNIFVAGVEERERRDISGAAGILPSGTTQLLWCDWTLDSVAVSYP